MFAVMKTGGKQYKVQTGDVLRLERIAAEAGETIQFNDILMIDATVGSPLIEGAGVQAQVIDQIKGEKLIHFVKRRRKHGSQRTKGHRQKLTLVRIGDILETGADETGVKAAIGTGSLSAAALAAMTPAKNKPAKPEQDRTAKPAKPKAAKVARPPKADVAEAAASTGSKPANLLDQARDGGPDDLKKISGVGPKLEETLHKNGVFHFDQVAAWTADEIAYMDEQLSFKGRIERDDWLTQAAAFAAEKE
ncbi:50S ribosomal protein L21 [Oceaniovalibus sp. ACAM 378]|jgi:large subunit ribosomal protein L21|uniref:50S ribosomal protein L21 n=1 Tax=Oceaniovalibus sp. ACAM 378 TaxID=2599923 RepID=UPI0011D43698|nr:50S ribosomal protein L21 [Oceaniovalibus sp. ACAM 378]TYB89835.1 50S ribosomal protein L21 [Oceaniovalibus sp. ACAM 378]